MEIFLGVLFLIICFLLIIVILLQKGRGGGLGAAFGGAGSAAFGTRTGDVFTWVTIVLTALFLILAVFTQLVYTPPAEVVAKPVFEPLPGAITEPVSVSMKSATPSATVHYTLTGAEPTQDSTVYEKNPVRVQPGMTIKARAFRPGWTPSPVSVGAYPLPSAESQPAVEAATLPATAPAGAQ